MKILLFLIVICLAIWLSNLAWFLFNIAMRNIVFAGVVGMIVVVGICIGVLTLYMRLMRGRSMNDL